MKERWIVFGETEDGNKEMLAIATTETMADDLSERFCNQQINGCSEKEFMYYGYCEEKDF